MIPGRVSVGVSAINLLVKGSQKHLVAWGHEVNVLSVVAQKVDRPILKSLILFTPCPSTCVCSTPNHPYLPTAA